MRGLKSSKTRLRWILGGVFVAVSVPTVLLIRQALSQLEADAFRRHDLLVQEFTRDLEQVLATAIDEENARPFGDYGFLSPGTADAGAGLSPLSAFPVESLVPGAVAYFQVDEDGELTTPLLPASGADVRSFGIADEEQAERRSLQRQVATILAENSLSGRPASAAPRAAAEAISSNDLEEQKSELDDAAERQSTVARLDSVSTASVAPPTVGQSVFDELVDSQGRTESFVAEREPKASSESRREQSAPQDADSVAVIEQRFRRIDAFANDIEPLRFSRLDSGEFVLFRNAWREGRRFVQGLLIEGDSFVERLLATRYRESELAAPGNLIVAFASRPLFSLTADNPTLAGNAIDTADALVRRERLPPPFADLELAFTADRLPPSPSLTVLGWLSLVFAIVLPGGFVVVYRLLAGQLALNQQQQDFVSAVSHELKTPLTSIRMYGEMLKAGWADDEKKRIYYNYIHDESERLTRLIDNVLQLARMGRGEAALHLEEAGISELLDLTRSRVASQADAARFELELRADDDVGDCVVSVDKDAFTQIMINLVDNAIKYSDGAELRSISIEAKRTAVDRIAFCVRDFGPGVPRGKLKKLFELFYRPHNELTRAVSGTGIGLALVSGLTQSMGGEVLVRNCNPGAEFQVILPVR